MIENDTLAWWEAEEEKESASLLYEYTKGIAEDQVNYQRYYDLRHARLYSNRFYSSLRGVTSGIKKDNGLGRGGLSLRLNQNIIRSAVDTVCAKITKKPVRPRFLTNGGDSMQQKKAQSANRYIQGLFFQTQMHDVSTDVFRDACIFGTGLMKHFIEQVPGEKGSKKQYRICNQRVMPDEIVVDPADAYYKKPQSIMQVSFPSKKALIQIFPDKEKEILAATPEESMIQYGNQQEYLQVVMVIEGWVKKTPHRQGRRVMSLGEVCLCDEPWPFDFFPFSVIRYSEPIYGFFGTGICEELTGLQMEINRLMMTTQKSMHLLAKPKVFYQKGSMNPDTYNNEEGTFVPYEGPIQPYVVTANPVPASAFNQIETYRQTAFNLVGINEMTAGGSVSSQLSSGKAIREVRDVETERFSKTVHAFEQFHIEAAEKMLELVRYIGQKNQDYQVSSFDRKGGMEILNWKDIALDKNGYVMQVYPTSGLSDTWAGRIRDIEDLARSGIIPQEYLGRLLDFPDLDGYQRIEYANRDYLKENIEKMLRGETANLPEATDDLDYCLKLVKGYKSMALKNELDDNILAELDNYQEYLLFLIEKATMPPQQALVGLPSDPNAPVASPGEADISTTDISNVV